MITAIIIFFGISLMSVVFLRQANRTRARIIENVNLSKIRDRTKEVMELVKEIEGIEADLARLSAEVIGLRKLAIKRKKHR